MISRVRSASLLLLIMVVTGCLDEATGPRLSGKAAVSGSGGNFQFEQGRVVFEIPPGAVKENVIIGVDPTDAFPSDLRVTSGTVFDFTPDGLEFDVPVTVTVSTIRKRWRQAFRKSG